MSGWFKFPRAFFGDGGLKRAKPCSEFEAKAWMLFKAAYEPTAIYANGDMVAIAPGQFAAANSVMREEFGWSKSRVTGFLKRLQKRGFISLATDQGITIITICNLEENKDSKKKKSPATLPASDRKTTATPTHKKKKKEKEPEDSVSSFGEDSTASPREGDIQAQPQIQTPTRTQTLAPSDPAAPVGASPSTRRKPAASTALALRRAGGWATTNRQPAVPGSRAALPMISPEADAPPLAPSRYRADLDGSLPEGHRQALARSRASNSLIAESRAAAAKSNLREEGSPQTGPTPPLNPPKAEP